MTCVLCGLPIADEKLATAIDGNKHRRCAYIALSQATRPGSPFCVKHGAALDETGWCPRCREGTV